ncbi:MAG: GNAT family N-acetyltransferase [Clostridiales bacterium]|nr:GNAT family N-acetyltransferase [Clostridiales bacterium]
MKIRKAIAKDVDKIVLLALKLWPNHEFKELKSEFIDLLKNNKASLFLAELDNTPIGFAQCQLRFDYVEGTCSSPVGYLEGIFVEENFRNKHISKKLLTKCEQWAKEKGCVEFASDCEIQNKISIKVHKHLGFEETNRIVCFRKKLD